MAADENNRPSSPSETSPLLGPSGGASLGSSTVSSSSATAVGDGGDDGGDGEVMDGSGSNCAPENGEGGGDDHGVPELAKKLHLLLPALAVGIFLSALDQTLIVATYAKMSSDLHALNRTSWISTV